MSVNIYHFYWSEVAYTDRRQLRKETASDKTLSPRETGAAAPYNIRTDRH